MPESPKTRPRQNAEVKDGTPKKQKQCNCKHSRCLKLYCECFASGIYCDGCNCVNCHNNIESEPARKEAVDTTLERNPYAFMPKIASSPQGNRDNREESGFGRHNKGCHCKKSGCLKKYCECFQANILCSDKCKCMDCKNFEASEERKAIFNGDSNNNIAYLNQAAHAAIAGATGISSYGSPPVFRKRKPQEFLFGGPTEKDTSFQRVGAAQQMNHVNASAPSSLWPSVPGARVANNEPAIPSKSTYRSLLADVIHSEDMKELCAVLVVYANEARKLAEQRNATDKMRTDNSGDVPTTSDAQNPEADRPALDMVGPDMTDDGSKGRPMSPGTLALMCDEHDSVFKDSSTNEIQDRSAASNGHLPNGHVITESYAEQERTVLTTFRDYLNKLITIGELKETKCCALARGDIEGESQKDTLKSVTTSACQDPVVSGISRSDIGPTTQPSSNNDSHTDLKSQFHTENGDLNVKPDKNV
ncbi:protein tesmin/TSO1-like CXC 5 isoform X2 [Rutidosis leptorrhynchoides]